MKEKKSVTEVEALNRLMQLCSHSEKSSFEVRKKLKEWGLEGKADNILKKLINDKFIDDTRYAAAFVHDKIRINKWGKIKVNYLLKGQQLKHNDIDQALNSIDNEEYREMVFEELQRKRKSIKTSSFLQMKSKLYAFGAQRGYESDLIHRYFESEQK